MSGNISPSEARNSKANPPHVLKIGGLTPFSATDYPGKLATVIFVQGCPWRCGYCHNPHLQPRAQQSPLSWLQVLDFLHSRVGLIDAVVFSGGEPAIDPGLAQAIWTVRKLGFKIGMHSAGIYPERLAEILPWLDWIGLDIKAPFEHYENITGIANSGQQAQASAAAVLASNVDYEFRTTLHPSLLPPDAVVALAQSLADLGVKNYAMQSFRAQGCANVELKTASHAGYPSDALVSQVARLFPHFTMRRS